MLTDEERSECIRLKEWQKENNRLGIPAILIFLASMTIAILIYNQIPIGDDPIDYPEFVVPAILIILGGPIISKYLWNKSKKVKISGYEQNIVHVFKSYESLELYEKDRLPKRLEKASIELETILTNLKLFGEKEEEKPIFRFLETSVHDLIEKIDFRLIPAIEDAKESDIPKLKETLEMIIRCFHSTSLSDLKITVQNLDQYDDKSEKEKPLKDRIMGTKSGKTLVYIVISIGIGSIVAGLAQIFVNENPPWFMAGLVGTIGSATILFTRKTRQE